MIERYLVDEYGRVLAIEDVRGEHLMVRPVDIPEAETEIMHEMDVEAPRAKMCESLAEAQSYAATF